MANTNTYILPQLLAAGLPALRQNAIMSRLVLRDLETLAAQRGNQIDIPIPSVVTTRAITAAGTYVAASAWSPTLASVSLDQWNETALSWTDKDEMDIQRGYVPVQLTEAFKALANTIDNFMIQRAYEAFQGYAGTAGTTPFASLIDVAVSARVHLNKQLAPISDRVVVLDPMAEGNALKLANLLNFYQRGDQSAIVGGEIGRTLGMDWYMDQNLATCTFANTAVWVTGFSSDGSATIGSTSMGVINTTATGSLNAGAKFTLAGGSQVYTVITNIAVTASSTFTLYFQPGLTTAAATSGALTVIATYLPNLVFHRDALAFCSRPVANTVRGYGHDISQAIDPVTGIAFKIEMSRQYHQTYLSVSALYGSKVVRGAHGTILFG